jgi:hypothetical protein
MAKHKHGATNADLHQDDELHVTRTTPQGTQEAGVEKGHEQRDIKIRATLNWFIGLTVGTAITIVAMVVLVAWLNKADSVQKNKVSSPLYITEHTRRYPELLPNPGQMNDPDPARRYVYPWDHYRQFVKDESAKMKDAGLEMPDGRPGLPQDAVSAVMSEPSRRTMPAEMDEKRPSDESGGRDNYNAILTR